MIIRARRPRNAFSHKREPIRGSLGLVFLPPHSFTHWKQQDLGCCGSPQMFVGRISLRRRRALRQLRSPAGLLAASSMGHEQARLASGLASDSRAVDRSSPAVGDDYCAWHACRLTNLGEPNLFLPSRGIAVSTGLSF